MKEYRFEEGGLWDEKHFFIKTNYEFPLAYEHKCKHVKDGKLKSVVIGINEAGYNSTGICLECIIEASKTIEDL